MQRRSKVEEVWSKIHDVLIKFDIINTVRPFLINTRLADPLTTQIRVKSAHQYRVFRNGLIIIITILLVINKYFELIKYDTLIPNNVNTIRMDTYKIIIIQNNNKYNNAMGSWDTSTNLL
jgi:hypothetical protein